MPELPEVEVTCQGIKPHILQQDLSHIIIRQKKLRWPIPTALGTLTNTKILDVTRRAKYILITTNKGTLIIHLGMSGRLSIVTEDVLLQKHDHVDLIFHNGTLLRYTDPRRFGAFLFTNKDPHQYPLLAKLGPEPFSPAFNANYLLTCAARKTVKLKLFIMDQAVVVGVGNIYANEALFSAGISPLRSAHSLQRDEAERLVKVIRTILKKAILTGGTTLKDFFSPEGKMGYFVQKLFVYGRGNEPCLRCNTRLTVMQLSQRTTVFCHSCQK